MRPAVRIPTRCSCWRGPTVFCPVHSSWAPPGCCTGCSLPLTLPKDDIMTTRRHVLCALIAGPAVLAGCAGPQVVDYAQQRPRLELDRYFSGRVRAHGIFQKRSGEVSRRFTVIMDCHWEGNQ